MRRRGGTGTVQVSATGPLARDVAAGDREALAIEAALRSAGALKPGQPFRNLFMLRNPAVENRGYFTYAPAPQGRVGVETGYAADFADYLSTALRPMYLADGRKLPDIYTHPAGLRDELQGALGEFPLFRFWGPGADIVSSRWIAQAALKVLDAQRPTLTLVYLPHLDYDLQRFGPHHPGIPAQVAAVESNDLAALSTAAVRALKVPVIASERRLTIWTWYSVGGHPTVSPSTGKLWQAWNMLSGNQTPGRVFVLITDGSDPPDVVDERLSGFLGAAAAQLDRLGLAD